MNKLHILAALTSAVLLTSAFAGCGISSSTKDSSAQSASTSESSDSSFAPEKIAEKFYAAMVSRDFRTLLDMTVPPDMQDEFKEDYFSDFDEKPTDDLYTVYIRKQEEAVKEMEAEGIDFKYEVLACEELGKFDKINKIFLEEMEDETDTVDEDFDAAEALDIKLTEFAKADEGEPVYAALVKVIYTYKNEDGSTQKPDTDIDMALIYRHNGEWYIDHP